MPDITEKIIQKVNLANVKPSTEAHPLSVNGRLAECLKSQKDLILSEWIERVCGDNTIPTERLSTVALKDHLPELFDDLIKTLCRYGSTEAAEQTEKDAEKHGEMRWQQGYELTQMLGEVKHLRAVLIYHLRVFDEMNQDLGAVERLFVSATLHRFLDEMGINATRQFLDEGCKGRDSE